MMKGPSASRPSAPDIEPIEHQGIRYEQDNHGDQSGDQPGGYLVAVDAKTGQRLWRLKVYEVPDPRAIGRPTLARYFRAMRLAPDGATLEIENEAGGVYRVDLTIRTVAQISGPPTNAARPASVPSKPQPQ